MAATQFPPQPAIAVSHPLPGVYLTSKFNKLLNKWQQQVAAASGSARLPPCERHLGAQPGNGKFLRRLFDLWLSLILQEGPRAAPSAPNLRGINNLPDG